ncbi:MAG: aldehyde ferredoxin oxidoreductase family protein [Myxococcota bacterium]|nr:aldehyde ferredoxin oxidoreductase family protein [Myxococcota bacterium]
MHGNHNRLLEVDLTAGTTSETSLPDDAWREFVGGSGIGAWLFLRRAIPAPDPLSPDNPLIVMTGPLAGTTFPGGGRFAVCGRSPLTGIWGEGTCGGSFGPALKTAGFDGIVVTGRAAAPVRLVVEEGKAEIRDARDLWGKDTYEVDDAIERMHGKRARAICIGPAGENLVRYANITHGKGDFIGRTGMGAVMGSKNLKAIVARGGAARPEPHDRALYDATRRSVLDKIKESTPAASMHSMGTDAGMDLGMMTGDVPIKNWSIGEDFELSAALGGPTMTEKFLVRPAACQGCPIACRRVMKSQGGPHAIEEGPGPEYETCCALGTNLLNRSAEALLKANETANRLGMDTISLGGTLGFAMDCFDKGILTARDTGGIELRWGDMDAVLRMMGMIARREGFGDLLAEGVREAAARIGKGAADLAVHVKGLEAPFHDPHGWHGLGLAYMMSTRGACHLQHLVHPIEQGMVYFDGIGLEENYEGQASAGKGRMVKTAEDLGVPCNALVLCEFVAWCMSPADMAAVLSAVTGFGYDVPEYLRTGARIWLLKRGLCNLMGVTSADDVLPPKILKPYSEGAAAGSVPDQDLMRREYYAERGLEPDGRPSRAALDAAGGLDEIKRRLYARVS